MNKRTQTTRAGLIGLLIITAVVVTGFAPREAAAAEESKGDTSSITLSPSAKRMTLDAGKELRDKLTVVNTGATELNFIVYGRPYSVAGEAYTPSYEATPPNSDAYRWLSFDRTEWQLAAGKTVEIPYTLRVPAGAAPGGHYGVIFVETRAPKGNGQVIVRNKRLGSILQVTVNGQYRTGGDWLGGSIGFYQPRTPLEASTRIRNTGNSDFDTTLRMTVSDMLGRVKYQTESKFVVYPDTTRAMQVQWQNSPWFGLYKVKLAADFLDQNRSAESYVLIAPRWMPVVLLLVLLGGGVYALRRRR